VEDAPAEVDIEAPPATRACLNCDRPVHTRFCPDCGQRQDLRPLSLHGLVWELLIEILDTDARVWRTLRCLVREPGQLTLDWAAGRRMRHVPPFRLYLVLNVLVFLVFSLAEETPLAFSGQDASFEQREAQLEAELEELEARTGPGVESERRALQRALAAVRSARTARAEMAVAGKGEAEAPEAATNIDLTTDPEFTAFLASLGVDRERAEAAIVETIEHPREFAEQIYERLPTVMILLLPVLALVMSLLYFLTGRPYVVHLVGLAHLHGFFFLLLLLVEGFEGFGTLMATLHVPMLPALFAWAPTIGFTVGFWYLASWLRRLYGHGTAGAIGMSLVLLTLHLIGAALGVAVVMALTLLASARG
jgi:hypothetical protein